ncbi:MAG TPA: methyltransferase domain-containing protein [Candidatus Dojkabacteria bacterium]|nr:methyltransferase domain-containing protein [Candidatus Dojkabacteria bacterium]
MKISNYDEYGYDYKTYWNNRDYEDHAEKVFLKKELKNRKGNWFIDIGGSFGRNLPVYYSQFDNPVIIDYSLETLQKNNDGIKKDYPNTHLIAANAYNLPFKDKTFDGGVMIRVLHHIESPDQYFKEISRAMNGKATYIQEIANKVHFKANIRNMLIGNRSFFTEEPYQQPSQGNFEGTEGESTIFLNFHPNHIKKLLNENGFKIIRLQGVSFFRIPFIKKFFPISVLTAAETLTQKLFRGKYFAPSIFISTTKDDAQDKSPNKLEDILVCPICKGDLKFSKETATCTSCNKTFEKKKNIWDFRV